MNKEIVIGLAEKIIKIGDGQNREEFMAALRTAVAGSIYHSYREQDRQRGLEEFCANMPAALQAIIDGYARKAKLS